MDSSSGSDSYYDRERARRPRGREAQRRPARESRANGGGGGHRLVNGVTGSAAAGSAGISEKISTLASTLQDTSRNLNKVDKMLGQYREHTDDQAEAMAMLKENLEESISQLQSQRHRRPSPQSRSHRTHSASASTLHTSDLEAGSASGSGPEGPRFIPTSHLKDYTGTESAPPIRRRSLSAATVRFSDPCPVHPEAHVQRLHQSLRDLCSDQMRLSDDLDREIVRRNRSEIETRRAMESLSQHLSPPPKQDLVSSRVERRLQDLEREMAATERQSVLMSEERLEALGRQQTQERDEAVKARLLRSEQDKTKMEQELDRTRRLLEQTKDSRESLEQQVEDMRGELQRTGKETAELRRSQQDLQREISQLSVPPPRPPYADREDRGRPGVVGPDRSDLEKEVAELRGELRKASVLGEVDELKRTLERSEKERIQLCTRLEELTSDLTRREQQQLRMLEQLKDIQGRGQTERSDTETLLQESARSREELKSRAQEAVRQWRAKCRRLQKELDEARTQAQEHTDKASQVSRERESSQAHLKSLSQQSEVSRRELSEVLGRLAQREDEVHRKDVELSETRQRHLSLEQEIREVRDASAALEQEAQRQAVLQARLREENHRLEEQAVLQAQLREENRRLEEQAARRSLRDREAQAELQAAVKELSAARAHSARQLAAEEGSGKELHRAASELRAKLGAAQDERASVLQQLQLEREVHQKELDNLRAAAGDDRAKRDQELQETLRLCRQEREEMKAVVTEAKVDVAAEKELCRALRVKVDRMKEQCDKLSQELLSKEDRMKEQCDKLTQELLSKEEEHSLLQRRHQLLQQDLDHKAAAGEERRRDAEAECGVLEERLSRLGAEREALLASVGEELDVACRSLARGSEDKLQAISQKPGLVKEPPCWLAETKTKLRWLCEEVRERETRDRRLRKQQQQQTRDQLKALRESRDSEQSMLLQQTRDQLKALRESRDSEQSVLLQRLDRQEKLLLSLSADKKELLERSRRKEEEVRILQDRILDLEMSTRLALDHLESVPEKLCLMEDFKDLEESQRQRELVQQRYAKYKEIVCDLQHQLDESKRKMQEYRDEKLDATSRSLRLAALSSSLKGPGAFLSPSHRSHALSPQKCPSSSDVDVSTVNGAMTPSERLSLK